MIVSLKEELPDKSSPLYSLISRYTRKGNDLVYTYSMTLQQAINCEPVKIKTLDGRTLVVSVDTIVSPKFVKKIDGEGMPILYRGRPERDEMAKGDLYIKFDIRFPKTLT